MLIDDNLPADEDEAYAAGWEYMNEGTERTAFEHPLHPDRILKLGKWSGYIQQETEVLTWEGLVGGPFEHLATPILAARSDFIATLVKRERYPSAEDRRGFPEIVGPAWRLFDDLHEGNLAGIVDDYGDVVYTRALDYGL